MTPASEHSRTIAHRLSPPQHALDGVHFRASSEQRRQTGGIRVRPWNPSPMDENLLTARGGGALEKRTSRATTCTHPCSSTNGETTRKPAVSAPIISFGKSLGGGLGPTVMVRWLSKRPVT
jgi:hypothetical protein